jgi:asparagine synthase (glutamine-hydrolysing)
MRGLLGFLGGYFHSDDASALLQKMAHSMSHRGPYDSGVWFDEQTQMGFAHLRLSIIDLSPAGHQPMVSNSGCYVFVFNGEISVHDNFFIRPFHVTDIQTEAA